MGGKEYVVVGGGVFGVGGVSGLTDDATRPRRVLPGAVIMIIGCMLWLSRGGIASVQWFSRGRGPLQRVRLYSASRPPIRLNFSQHARRLRNLVSISRRTHADHSKETLDASEQEMPYYYWAEQTLFDKTTGDRRFLSFRLLPLPVPRKPRCLIF